MQKIKYKHLALAVLVTLASLSPVAAQAKKPILLKVSHFLPPSAPGHSQFIEPWCEKIKAESDGELQCQIYPAMQLGGTPTQLFNQARAPDG